MRGVGILFCVGAVIIAVFGVLAYFADRDGLGVALMVISAGFFAIGVMIFLTDFALRLANRNANLFFRGRFFNIELMLKGGLRSIEGESEGSDGSRGYLGDKGAESDKEWQ